MKRAYSLLEIRAVDDDARVIEGVATTPTTDSYGDIVEPKGAEFNLPIPLLWQHDSGQPIGHVIAAKVTTAGIEIKAKLADLTEPGKLKDRLDEAWQSIKAKLVRGLSIGFQPIESARIEGTYGYRFLQWRWLELSAVTIPANTDCSIQTIKSFDRQQRAALGIQRRSSVVRLDNSPGASGTNPKHQENVMNTKEQIAAFETQRKQKAERMDAIMSKSAEEGRTLNEAETEEYDTLQGEVEQIDAHIKRLEAHEKRQAEMAAKATPVAGRTEAEGSRTRGGAGVITGAPAILLNREPDEKFKGQFFVRMQIAKALAFLQQRSQTSIAIERGWHPTLVEVIKANEVPGGGTGSGEWGAELVQADARYTGDFINFLYSKTVFDRLPLREVPENVTIKGQDGQATGYWTGESKAIKATAPSFSSVTLTPLDVGAIAVVSNRLLRTSSPAAEALVRDALVNAIAQAVDATFLSASAASAGVSPAGILNGVASMGSLGTDGAAVRGDIRQLYAPFIAAKNASDLALVSDKSIAKSISLLVNALGQTEFSNVTQEGGNLLGDPYFTGDNVGTGDLILLKPSDIYKIGDTGVQVSISRDATVEMATDPTGASDTPAGGTKNPVSLWQTDSTGFKVTRGINFAKRRSDAVQYVRDASYGEMQTES